MNFTVKFRKIRRVRNLDEIKKSVSTVYTDVLRKPNDNSISIIYHTLLKNIIGLYSTAVIMYQRYNIVFCTSFESIILGKNKYKDTL